ncbi:MAG: DUF29 domain-containing protein, partial [Candidatus Tectomicrobia bacterium]|nr:DUF29 domain-containing protein [Candidatus Tectomicrobia bacterium]
MEELLELRAHIEQGRYTEALALIGEMEEMSRDDKINKIEGFLHILLVHLIKQHAEQRSTRSWEVSIKNAVDGVNRVNKRRKAGGYYLTRDELKESIDEIYPTSLRQASLEAFEGRYDDTELATKIYEHKIKKEALQKE